MKKEQLYIKLMIAATIILFIAIISFYIFIMIKYGGLPPDEVPSWIHWIMVGGK